MRALILMFACWMLLGATVPYLAQAAATDAEITERIIAESIAAYPGNCPCPYNRAANGSQCGKRSAWSRAGGYAPLCYPDDVTPEMIDEYRRTHDG
jgi:hypothetical protein